MGDFNINITGVGGHGCERKAGPGDKLYGRCGRFNCPDCLAYEFVQRLRQAGTLREGESATGQELKDNETPPPGAIVYEVDLPDHHDPDGPKLHKRFWRRMQHATFTHWPDSPSRVVDDMLSNERVSGRF